VELESGKNFIRPLPNTHMLRHFLVTYQAITKRLHLSWSAIICQTISIAGYVVQELSFSSHHHSLDVHFGWQYPCNIAD